MYIFVCKLFLFFPKKRDDRRESAEHPTFSIHNQDSVRHHCTDTRALCNYTPQKFPLRFPIISRKLEKIDQHTETGTLDFHSVSPFDFPISSVSNLVKICIHGKVKNILIAISLFFQLIFLFLVFLPSDVQCTSRNKRWMSFFLGFSATAVAATYKHNTREFSQ